MQLLFGKPVADQILADTKKRIDTMRRPPGLAVILVGEDVASHLYVRLKENAAEKVGMYFERHILPVSSPVDEIFRVIDILNKRDDIDGIIVQLPLPNGFPTDEIIARIDPEKDADGFHPITIHQFLSGQDMLCPVFPRAMVALLRLSKRRYSGEKGLVIANSELLGKVMKQALIQEGLDADFVLSTEKKEHLIRETRRAAVIFTACGIPQFITGDMIADDVVIVDGGMNTVSGSVVGDVDRASVDAKSGFLSSVPGGVGPITVATLLARVTEVAIRRLD